MYNEFKNTFISELSQLDLKLTSAQMNAILTVLDKTAKNYTFINKTYMIGGRQPNGVPSSVYEYLTYKKSEGLSSQTTYAYRIVLETFFKYCHKPPELIQSKDIMEYLTAYQKLHNITNRTLDKYRQHITCYFQFMHDHAYIPINPAKQIHKIKYEVPPRYTLTEYELELVREACSTRRESAIVEFLISTACRAGELVCVKVADVNFDTLQVHLFGKGNKHRTSFISPRCRLLLERYLQYRDGESEYLFIHDIPPYTSLTVRSIEIIIKNIINKVQMVCQNKHITPHRFRATSATQAYTRGMSIDNISKWLGHSDLRVTEGYISNNIDTVHNEYKKYMH